MSAISQLQQASHGGIKFPYLDCKVRIDHRHFVHVYINTNGGEVEKLGLSLRKFTFSIPAHDTLGAPYKNFYSLELPKLWSLWESGATAPCVIPSVGTIQGFVTDATRTIGKMASGEAVEVSVLEDSRTLDTLAAVFTPTVNALPTQLRSTVRACQAVGAPQSLLDRLISAVGDALALAARGDTFAQQWTAKITTVVNLCEAIRNTPALALPASFQALDTLLELHFTAVTLREDGQRRGRTVSTWPAVTPSRMAVGQIAAWIYGSTFRASELLILNDWEDPLAVPRGSVVRFYAS